MAMYKSIAKTPLQKLQYDQGEDRWLCTLMLTAGGRIEFEASRQGVRKVLWKRKFLEIFLIFLKYPISVIAIHLHRKIWTHFTNNDVDGHGSDIELVSVVSETTVNRSNHYHTKGTLNHGQCLANDKESVGS